MSQAEVDSTGPIKERAQIEPDWTIRTEAIEALGNFKTNEAISALDEIAGSDSSAFNRITAVRHLSHIGGSNVKERLRKHWLTEKDLGVRLNAAREMAHYGDMAGYELAKKSLKASDWQARYAAAGVLSYVAKPSDITALNQVADDPKEMGTVRAAAFAAAHHIALVHLSGQDQMTLLEKNLADDHRRAREWAAGELVLRNDNDARALLNKIVAQVNHPGRAEAFQALQALSRKESTP